MSRETAPPAADWVHHAHYVSDGDYSRRRAGEEWETWDHKAQQWFRTPTMMVSLIERGLDGD